MRRRFAIPFKSLYMKVSMLSLVFRDETERRNDQNGYDMLINRQERLQQETNAVLQELKLWERLSEGEYLSRWIVPRWG